MSFRSQLLQGCDRGLVHCGGGGGLLVCICPAQELTDAHPKDDEGHGSTAESRGFSDGLTERVCLFQYFELNFYFMLHLMPNGC